MLLWRIATETRTYSADDVSGGGAAAKPGRWNDVNEAVLYCAPAISLAVLETAAYVDSAGLPLDRYLVRIEVADDVWKAREEPALEDLPPTWNAIPAGRGSAQYGSAWLAAGRTAILAVPSVIVPEERCALINPKHADAPKSAVAVRQFEYNKLFRG